MASADVCQSFLERLRHGRVGTLRRGVDEEALGERQVIERVNLLPVFEGVHAVFRGRGDVGRPAIDICLESRLTERLEQFGGGIDAGTAIGVRVATGSRGRKLRIAVGAVGGVHLGVSIEVRPGPPRGLAEPVGVAREGLVEARVNTGSVGQAGRGVGRRPRGLGGIETRLRIAAGIAGAVVVAAARNAVEEPPVGILHLEQPVELPLHLVEQVRNPVAALRDVRIIAEGPRVQLVGPEQVEQGGFQVRDILVEISRIEPAPEHVRGRPCALPPCVYCAARSWSFPR